MIALSTIAQDLLAQDGAEVAIEVTVGAPVSTDITPFVTRVPTIRTSVRPMERTTDIGSLSIVCDNPNNLLSHWNGSGVFGSQKWSGALVTVKLGVWLGPSTTELVTVFAGDLDDIVEHIPGQSVELLCVDPFSRLKRNSVDGLTLGSVYTWQPPSDIIKSLLTAAGYGSRLVDATFDDEGDMEASEGAIIREYAVPEGQWWGAIQELLRHNNAGLRITTGGDIEQFKFRPLLAGPAVVLSTSEDLGPIVARKPSADIINQFSVTRKTDGGGDADTVNSPVADAQSVTDYGTIDQALGTQFAHDTPAEGLASELLGSKAQPPLIIEVPATIRHFPVELWDESTIEDEDGFSATGFVFEKSIEPDSLKTALKVYATSINTSPWLFCDNAQQLDDAQLVF